MGKTLSGTRGTKQKDKGSLRGREKERGELEKGNGIESCHKM